MTLSELVDIGDKSEVAYAFEVVESEDRTNLFPIHDNDNRRVLTFPHVSTSDDGSRYLAEYEFGETAVTALKEAEQHFDAGEYGAAMAIYQRATEGDPDCYVLHSHIGDCLLRTGHPKEALASYRKALSLNAFDFRTHWFIGDALFDLGEYQEARKAYVEALVLRPGYAPLLDLMESRASMLGITIRDERFQAQAGARRDADQIVIVAPKPQYWQLYGLCHAIWLGEPTHRERMTGKQEHNWTSTETTECLLILLEGYDRFGPLEGGARDPIVERLERIHERGYLEQFVYYELGAQGLYTPILLAPEKFRSDLKEYVAEFVIIERGKGVSSADGDN